MLNGEHMNTYEISAIIDREEVNFAPIEATDIHAAARQVRELFARTSFWMTGVKPFMATVTISGRSATVKMPVECASHEDVIPVELTEEAFERGLLPNVINDYKIRTR